MPGIRRREFVSLFGGAAARGRSRRARSRPARSGGSACWTPRPRRSTARTSTLPRRHAALGYVEGQNLRIDYRSFDGRIERLPQLAAELVGLQVRRHRDAGHTAGARRQKRWPARFRS